MSSGQGSSGAGSLDNFFRIREHGSSIKIEVIAGLTTFLTCVYILAVNPAILKDAGMDVRAVFWATAVISALGSIALGLFTNFPFALAPGMGLNTYFTYYVVLSLGLTWQNALGCVLISGICFVIFSLLKVQQHIVDEMPDCIKKSVGAGIGFFIAFTGMVQAKIVVAAGPATLIQVGDLGNPGAIMCMFGLALIVVLTLLNVRGSILIGILVVTIIGFFVQNPTPNFEGAITNYTMWPEGGLLRFDSPLEALAPTFGQLSFDGMFNNPAVPILGVLFVIFSFLFIDLFDGIAVLLGLSAKAGLLDKNGRLPKAGKALGITAGAATFGAVLGTNTVVIYGPESTAGIAAGGRTGLTAVVIGILFLVALLFSPLFLMIPSVATAPALIIVGIFMMEPLKDLDLDDLTIAFPVFMAVAVMPFTYSIAHGILFSVLAYTLAHVAARRFNEISKMMWCLTAVFLFYLVWDIVNSIMHTAP